jgi:hypothetical protein
MTRRHSKRQLDRDSGLYAVIAGQGPPGNSAVLINRVDVITISVILVGLPWIVRRARGPVAAVGGPG